MTITIKRNEKIQSLQIIDNICVCIYIYIYIYKCIYYTTEKYKRKMYYHQKNNSNVKIFEKPKNIKES